MIKSTVAPQAWLSYVPLITVVFAVNAVALVKLYTNYSHDTQTGTCYSTLGHCVQNVVME